MQNANFKKLVEELERLNDVSDKASKDWNAAFPKDSSYKMGLTPDNIKFSPEYQNFKRNYEIAHNNVRKVMSLINKYFKKEYKQYCIERRNAKLKGV